MLAVAEAKRQFKEGLVKLRAELREDVGQLLRSERGGAHRLDK